MIDVFEEHRDLLFAAAYRMLGTAADAEDVVQDAWLRWSAADRTDVADPKAYLVRIATNLALDRLRSARAQIRNPDLNPALAAQVYVCRPPLETPTGRYLGTVHFQRLLREPPYTLVAGIVDHELTPLQPALTLEAVSSFLATYNLVASAVVDDDGRLLGAVTVDDVLDHLLPDDWRETVMDSVAEEAGDVREPADPAAEAEEEAVRRPR